MAPHTGHELRHQIVMIQELDIHIAQAGSDQSGVAYHQIESGSCPMGGFCRLFSGIRKGTEGNSASNLGVSLIASAQSSTENAPRV